MDLEKLTPAPIEVDECHGYYAFAAFSKNTVVGAFPERDDAEFYALAVNYLDVQVRRGWSCTKYPSGDWRVFSARDESALTHALSPYLQHPLAAWQWAVDYDAKLRAGEEAVENIK